MREHRLVVLLAVFVALLVIGVAVASPLVVDRVRDELARDTPDLDDVRVYDDLPNGHVDTDLDYAQAPPVGGAHDPAWLACGVYDEPVRDENAVHSLEHGTVWLSYEPGLPVADVEALAGTLPDEGILSPYPDQESPVVVTVWGRQLALTGADDPRLELFLVEYGDGHTSPEPFASCEGGVEEFESDSGASV